LFDSVLPVEGSEVFSYWRTKGGTRGRRCSTHTSKCKRTR